MRTKWLWADLPDWFKWILRHIRILGIAYWIINNFGYKRLFDKNLWGYAFMPPDDGQ